MVKNAGWTDFPDYLKGKAPAITPFLSKHKQLFKEFSVKLSAFHNVKNENESVIPGLMQETLRLVPNWCLTYLDDLNDVTARLIGQRKVPGPVVVGESCQKTLLTCLFIRNFKSIVGVDTV